jgi:gamma-glutamylaminecyclotransferase
MPRVFVYGTLRRGMHNHHFLCDSKFLGNGYTVDPFQMTTNGGIPFVHKYLVSGVPKTRIEGEVYEVNITDLLYGLDGLEGHPNFYCREETPIVMDNGTIENCWLYFCEHKGSEAVPDGDFVRYSSMARQKTVAFLDQY